MLLSTLLGTVSLATVSLAQTFTNPIRNPGADPHIVTHEGYYYLTNTQATLISVTRSKTISGLYEGETRTVYEETDPNRSENVWAPEMHLIDGIWYILYSAGAGDIPRGQRSYIIQGCDTNPYDCDYEFLAELTPAAGGQGGADGNDPWSIDGTYLQIGDDKYHVVAAYNAEGLQSIMIATLDTENWTVGPWNLISEPTEPWEMAEPKPDAPAALNEGPNPLYSNGRTWLSFSASFCGSPLYALGLLEYDGSGDPLDAASWTKTGPVFSAANENYSTAHNVFFSSPDGTEVWNAYHATTNPEGSCGTDRYTMAQIVNFDETGFPDLGEPVRGLTDIPVPSGDGS